MIKAILFDVDGVLVNEEKKYFSVHLEEELGISQKITKEFFATEFLDCVDGAKDLRDVLPKYLKAWGWDVSVNEALKYWHTKEHIVNEPLINEMTVYKEKGIKIYTATNQEVYRTKYIREDMGFGKIFDEVIASSMLGVRKPNHKYFQHILQRIQQEAQDVLFWDDRDENITAAEEVGMHAEHYQGFTQFKDIMFTKYNL